MKAQRLPRKLKKRIKAQVSFLVASRCAQSAVISCAAMAQVALIMAQHRSTDVTVGAFLADRAGSVAETVSNSATSISKIMSEKPNHWKDFLK